MPENHCEDYANSIALVLEDSSVTEFKWAELRNARNRFCALKMIDLVVAGELEQIRLDVLTWDTHDDRHDVAGRDDLENLGRMYYHVFRNVMRMRWPDNSVWDLRADENSAIDWETLEETLNVSPKVRVRLGPLPDGVERITQEFDINSISEVDSMDEPMVQLADLFAGMAVYSRENYAKYQAWLAEQSGQANLFEEDKSVDLSGADQERCLVLAEFNKKCKARKLGVSLDTQGGLWTPQPDNPINFWWYQPQHPDESAPVKQ